MRSRAPDRLRRAVHDARTELQRGAGDAAWRRLERAEKDTRDPESAAILARAMQEAGALFHRQGDLARALACYQRSLQALGPASSRVPAAAARSLLRIGQIQLVLGATEEAVGMFERALAEVPADEPDIEVHALIGLGNARRQFDDPEGARTFMQRAAELAEQRGSIALVSAVNSWASVLESLGDYERAVDHLRRALTLAETWGASGIGRASAERMVGRVLGRMGKLSDGLGHLERALRADSASGAKSVQGYDHVEIGVILLDAGRLAESGSHFDAALRLLASEDQVRRSALCGKGQLALQRDQPELAQQFFAEAAAVPPRGTAGPSASAAAPYQGLAITSELLGDREAAARSLETALELSGASLRSRFLYGSVLRTAGWRSLAHGDLDSASSWCNQAVQVHEELVPASPALARDLSDRAEVFRAQGSEDAAIADLTRAQELFDLAGSRSAWCVLNLRRLASVIEARDELGAQSLLERATAYETEIAGQ